MIVNVPMTSIDYCLPGSSSLYRENRQLRDLHSGLHAAADGRDVPREPRHGVHRERQLPGRPLLQRHGYLRMHRLLRERRGMHRMHDGLHAATGRVVPRGLQR